MKTKMLKSYHTEEAVNFLRKGQVVALPTETVYGLAADAKNDSAIHKIFRAKGRPLDHPLIVHIDSLKQVNDWAENIPEGFKELAKCFWPGPLTIILSKKNGVSDIITGGLNTIAVRIPNHPVILEIIKKLGNGIVAPSANAHQKTSPTSAYHVLKTLDGKIEAIVDGGMCSVGLESTIIDMTKEVPIILRPGAITLEMIEEVLKMKIDFPFYHSEKVAGNMKVHYQPEKPLFLLSLDEIESLSKKESNVAIMHYSKIVNKSNGFYYQMSKNKVEYAKQLYYTLNNIDTTNVKKILVEMPPNSIDWADICDRLIKACKK